MATADTTQPENPVPVLRSLRQRLGADIETVGVAPVPEAQRTMTPGKMFIVWLMASASATTPLIGFLLFPYGLAYMIAAIVVAFLGIGGILLAIAGIVQHVSTLLNDAGDVIIPFTFVMLMDWIYVQRRRTAVPAFFEQPRAAPAGSYQAPSPR